MPFKKNLERMGIEASVRVVDTSQYVNRIRSFDFDVFVMVIGQSLSPGNEQDNYWSCKAAERVVPEIIWEYVILPLTN